MIAGIIVIVTVVSPLNAIPCSLVIAKPLAAGGVAVKVYVLAAVEKSQNTASPEAFVLTWPPL